MNRTPIKNKSTKRAREDRERAKNLKEAYGPKPWRCRFSAYLHEATQRNPELVTWPDHITAMHVGCYGFVNGHEIHKSGQGGSRTDPENVVPLCNYHNDWLEDHPGFGKAIGLVYNPNKGETKPTPPTR